jgi:hypothetical protein
MTKATKAFALLLLLSTWFLPTQFALATELKSSNLAKFPSTQHQKDHADRENESEDESDDGEEGDEGEKQFAPPPLVVKHKNGGTGSSQQHDLNANSITGSRVNAVRGMVPSSNAILLKAASLGIVTLEQAFGTNDFVTAAVTNDNPDKTPPPANDGEQPKPGLTGEVVNPGLNEPVVNALSNVSYEDPGKEFIHKAYFGLAMLGAVAMVMAVHTISKTRRAAKADAQDYDYEGQN